MLLLHELFRTICTASKTISCGVLVSVHVHCMCAVASKQHSPTGASPAWLEAQDRTEEEEQKPDANYLVGERPTGWHSRYANSFGQAGCVWSNTSDTKLSCTAITLGCCLLLLKHQ